MKIPAIAPTDYSGTIANWMVALLQHGYKVDCDDNFYGDIMLTEKEYMEILGECEK